MNIKIDRQKVLAAAVLVVLILLGLGMVFLCQPLLKRIDQDREQLKAYAQETVFIRDLLGTRKANGIVAQLVAKDKISVVMDAINKLARQNTVTLTLVRPPFSSQDKSEGFKRVLFDMQAAASLKNMGIFLTAVRNMPEGLLDIDSLRVLPDEADAQIVIAKITFVLLVAKDNG